MKFDPSLYWVCDLEVIAARPLASLAQAACEGGVTMVQLRAKRASYSEIFAAAHVLNAILRPRGIPLIVNDHLDVALAIGAAGVHLGQGDASLAEARSQLGPRAILGLSVESLEQAAAAEHADYLGVSAIFATPTKSDVARLWGLQGLRELRACTSLPLVAIGGLSVENARAVIEAGADGIAVVSAIGAAPDPLRATRELRRTLDETPRPPRRYRRLLTIAGSDSIGGAGIQADLKTFAAHGAYGMSVLSALTAQNTQGVRAISEVAPDFVRAQLRAVFEDMGVDAIKIGMLQDEGVIRVVAEELQRAGVSRVVLDPVMVAKGGHRLLKEGAARRLREELFPRALLVTPNLPEAEVLLERPLRSAMDMEKAARDLLEYGPAFVLLKGGHGEGPESRDFLASREAEQWFTATRIVTPHTHGTGCTLSAALAAELSGSGELNFRAVAACVGRAKAYLSAAIREGAVYRLGQGQGPVQHFPRGWPDR